MKSRARFSEVFICYFMYMGVLVACISVYTCVPGILGDWEMVSDPAELELQTIGSYHVCAGH